MSATNVVRAGKRGNICVGNNVSSFARAFSTVRIILFRNARKFIIKSWILLFDLLFVVVKMLLQCSNALLWPCKLSSSFLLQVLGWSCLSQQMFSFPSHLVTRFIKTA